MANDREDTKTSAELAWMVDFSLDSVANVNLRKTDVKNFATYNEGDLYNNLFYKVCTFAECRKGPMELFQISMSRLTFSFNVFSGGQAVQGEL